MQRPGSCWPWSPFSGRGLFCVYGRKWDIWGLALFFRWGNKRKEVECLLPATLLLGNWTWTRAQGSISKFQSYFTVFQERQHFSAYIYKCLYPQGANDLKGAGSIFFAVFGYMSVTLVKNHSFHLLNTLLCARWLHYIITFLPFSEPIVKLLALFYR